MSSSSTGREPELLMAGHEIDSLTRSIFFLFKSLKATCRAIKNKILGRFSKYGARYTSRDAEAGENN